VITCRRTQPRIEADRCPSEKFELIETTLDAPGDGAELEGRGDGFEVEIFEREIRGESWPSTKRIAQFDIAATDDSIKDFSFEIAADAQRVVFVFDRSGFAR